MLNSTIRASPPAVGEPGDDHFLAEPVLVDDVDDSRLHTQAAVDERGEALVGAIKIALDIACPKQPIRPGAFRVAADTLAMTKRKRKSGSCIRIPSIPCSRLHTTT